MVTKEELLRALDDACAIAHEWDGEGISAKLAAFGLDALDVGEVLAERWEEYRKFHQGDDDRDHLLFIQGFVEGLITGKKLADKRVTA